MMHVSPLMAGDLKKPVKSQSSWTGRMVKSAWVVAGLALLSPMWRSGTVSRPHFLQPGVNQPAERDRFLRQNNGIPIKPLNQNATNACGTTALAMALNALAAIEYQDPNFQPLTYHDLDPGNRELDAYSAPNVLVRVAQDHGAYAQMINNSTFEDIAGHIQKGHPVIALTSENRGATFGSVHYVVIFKTDDHPDPMQRTITYANPATGQTVTMPYRQFVQNKSSHIKFKDTVPTGFNRFIIALSSQNDLADHREVPLTNYLATGVSNVLNNIGMLSRATQDKVVEPLYAWLNPVKPDVIDESDTLLEKLVQR